MQIYSASAQSLEPFYFNYTAEDGLPSSECYEIIQDRQGYIWISTDNGISRFDGTEFKNYGTEDGLTDKTILFMHEDHRGWIWMSSLNANVFICRGDSIVPYPYNQHLQERRESFYTIADFIVDTTGTLYLSLQNLGLAKISSEGVFEMVNFPYLEQGGRSYFIKDSQTLPITILLDKIEFRDYFDHLDAEYTQKNLILRPLIIEEELIKNVLPHKFNVSGRGASNTAGYATRLDNGLMIRNYDQLYWYPDFRNIEEYQTGTSNLKHFSFVITDPLTPGYYVGYQNYGDGLRYFPNMEDLLADQSLFHILPEHTITHLLHDRAGGLWIGSLENGVYYLPNPNNLSLSNSIDYRFSAIGAADQDKIISASAQGKILNITPNFERSQIPSLSWKHSLTEIIEFPSFKNTLVALSPLQVWGGSSWEFIYDDDPSRLLANDRPRLPLRDLVPCLDQKGHFWGIIAHQGLRKFKSSLVGGSHIETLEVVAPLKQVMAILEEEDRLWVGTRNGLFKYSKKDKTIASAGPEPILQERVEDILKISDTLIAVATRGSGLYFLGPNSLEQWTTADGLASDAISFIRSNGSSLWFGSKNGLHRVELAVGLPSLYIYNKKDGLGSSEILDVQLTPDYAWVVTTAGLTRMELKPPPVISVSPLLISNFLINGEEHDIAAQPSLSWSQNNIRAEFQFLSYAQAKAQRYRYRVGPDEDWTYSNNNHLDLLNLSPDSYTLDIQAINKWGKWVQASPIQFVVRPPFWRTPFFYLAGILSALLLSWAFFRQRIRQLSSEQEKLSLQKEVDQLKQQAYRAQMNPHFTFNCLSTIQGMIMGDASDKDAAVRLLANFSQLIRYALEASRQEMVSLKDEIDLLRRYLQLERERFSHSFDFSLTVDPALEPDWIQIPPMLVQPYVENAVLHGMADKESGGDIKLRYEQQEDQLVVTIADNGPGIFQRQAQQEKQGGKYRHKSAGMMITQKRIEMLSQGRYAPQIEELIDDQGHIVGTRITILIQTYSV